MASRGFSLIETAVRETREIARTLRGVRGIWSVGVVTGPNDVVVVMDSPNMNRMGSLLTERIHSVPG